MTVNNSRLGSNTAGRHDRSPYQNVSHKPKMNSIPARVPPPVAGPSRPATVEEFVGTVRLFTGIVEDQWPKCGARSGDHAHSGTTWPPPNSFCVCSFRSISGKSRGLCCPTVALC